MSGFQFVHLQQFSRKPVAGKAGVDGVVRGGRAGVSAVLAEAARAPGAALHVDAPRPPVLVAGLDPLAVQALHDVRADAARCQVAGGKPRKVRQDQATLLTVVASYAVSVSDCEADPVRAAERDAWQARNLEWFRTRFGDRLVGVVRHDDETYPHLHAFVLPDDDAMRANSLHPGWSAKQAAKAEAEAVGLDAKAANAAGDRAYREAMRAVQDDYWEAVGLPSGLARVGPARRRLTRDAWLAEQVVVTSTAKALDVAAVARAQAAQVTGQAAQVQEAAEARAADLAVQGRAFVERAHGAAADAVAMADAAELRRSAAEAAAVRLRVQAERQAALVVAAADRRAAGIVAAARGELARLTAFGTRVGALVASALGQSPARVAARLVPEIRAEEQAAATVQLATVREDLVLERQRAREVEKVAAALRASVGELVEERDRAQAEVAAIRGRRPAPKDGRTLG